MIPLLLQVTSRRLGKSTTPFGEERSSVLMRAVQQAQGLNPESKLSHASHSLSLTTQPQFSPFPSE